MFVKFLSFVKFFKGQDCFVFVKYLSFQGTELLYIRKVFESQVCKLFKGQDCFVFVKFVNEFCELFKGQDFFVFVKF